MNWDAEIWAPCRLGEPFTLWDLGSEHTEYLLSIKSDWFGSQHGDASSVRVKEHLLSKYPANVRVGAGPRPWTHCWTYEPKIKITPPTWVWDYADDLSFGLEIGQKRTGARQQIRLREVGIREGKAVYVFVKKDHEHEPDCTFFLESVPLLDPYFAPIWPVQAETIPDGRVELSELAAAAEKLQEVAQAVTVSFEEAADNVAQILTALSITKEETPEQEPAANEHKAAENERKPPGFPWFYYYTFDVPPAALGSIDEWKDLPPPPVVLADIERIRKERGSTTNA